MRNLAIGLLLVMKLTGCAPAPLSLPVIAEGQLTPSGVLRSMPSGRASGRIPVVLEYGDDVAALNLPAGSQANVAIYTESFQMFAILRKILLRIKSWENYIFVP